MESSEYLQTVQTMHGEARRRGLFFQTCTDDSLRARTLTLGGRRLVAFSSCSYLGLEYHPQLIAGVKEAVDRYGTQFSSSRGYVSAPPYAELEDLLGRIFGAPAMVAPTTTLGHQIALPVLATEKDGIVLDNQTHHSVQMAVTIARAGGAKVELVRHRELDQAKDTVLRLSRHCRTVWFACDGVFSMYGDLAPFQLLRELLDIAPNVRLYVDDAHGMSWAGRHGRGCFLHYMPDLHDRLVLITSMAKAFGTGGGCLVFHTEQERELARMCGGPMVFSGPIQPPMLGASIASARLHLSDEIAKRQQALRERVDLCNLLFREYRLPLLSENESPIFFLRLGLPRVAFAVAERMVAEGYYLNVSMYPTVPMKRAGIRLALTTEHDPEDIKRVMAGLAHHVPEVLREQGLSRDELDDLFRSAVPGESRQSPVYRQASVYQQAPEVAQVPTFRTTGTRADPGTLTLQHHRTIGDVDKDTWDRALGAAGACSWDAMALLERVFRGHEKKEHDWDFHYFLVRDQAQKPVCVTFFTQMLHKDDMLMRDEVSRAVEQRRTTDPYFLTSVVLCAGSGLSEGNHIFLDREGPWRAALSLVLEAAQKEYDQVGAALLLLRDLPGEDPEMDQFLLAEGLVKVPMFDSHQLEITWQDDEGFLARLSKRQRKQMRERLLSTVHVQRHVFGQGRDGRTLGADEVRYLYRLYHNVASRKLRLNVFLLPEDLIPAMLTCPAWEIVTVTLSPEGGGPADGRPVAWYAAHLYPGDGGHYAPLFCGLDYRYVYTQGAYRHMLLQIVKRAEELGLRHVHLGMDADMEKAHFHTRVVKNCVYLQARDHFQGEILREIAASVGLDASPWQQKDADHLPRPRDKWFEGARR